MSLFIDHCFFSWCKYFHRMLYFTDHTSIYDFSARMCCYFRMLEYSQRSHHLIFFIGVINDDLVILYFHQWLTVVKHSTERSPIDGFPTSTWLIRLQCTCICWLLRRLSNLMARSWLAFLFFYRPVVIECLLSLVRRNQSIAFEETCDRARFAE